MRGLRQVDPRATIEGDIRETIKTLQPSQNLIAIATRMFRDAWAMRALQAKDTLQTAKRKITGRERESDQVLARILEAGNSTVVRAYEDKIATLERDKALLVENLTKQVPTKGAFEEELELALKILSNPWKIWEKSNISTRRLILKLAFAEPIPYDRNEGARTPQISSPFKVLGVIGGGEFSYGAAGEN